MAPRKPKPRKAAAPRMGAGAPLPPCAEYMGCLCAGHARGNAADAPCDTSECTCDDGRSCSVCRRRDAGTRFKPETPDLLLILTSSCDDAHDAPRILGPYADDAERVKAASLILDNEDGDRDGGDDPDDDDGGRYLWRLDLRREMGAPLTVGACVTEAEREAARPAPESPREAALRASVLKLRTALDACIDSQDCNGYIGVQTLAEARLARASARVALGKTV